MSSPRLYRSNSSHYPYSLHQNSLSPLSGRGPRFIHSEAIALFYISQQELSKGRTSNALPHRMLVPSTFYAEEARQDRFPPSQPSPSSPLHDILLQLSPLTPRYTKEYPLRSSGKITVMPTDRYSRPQSHTAQETLSQANHGSSVWSRSSRRGQRTLAQILMSLLNRVTAANVSTIAEQFVNHCQHELDALPSEEEDQISEKLQCLVKSSARSFFDKALHEAGFVSVYAQVLRAALQQSTSLQKVQLYLNQLVKQLLNKAEQEWIQGFSSPLTDTTSSLCSRDSDEDIHTALMTRCKGIARLLTAFTVDEQLLLSLCQCTQILSAHLLKRLQLLNTTIPSRVLTSSTNLTLGLSTEDSLSHSIHEAEWNTRTAQKTLDTLSVALSQDFIQLLTTSVCGLFFLSHCLTVLKPLQNASIISRRIAAQAANVTERIHQELLKDTTWEECPVSNEEIIPEDKRYRLPAVLLTAKMHLHLSSIKGPLCREPRASGSEFKRFTKDKQQKPFHSMGATKKEWSQPSTLNDELHSLQSLAYELVNHIKPKYFRPLIVHWIAFLFESARDPLLGILFECVRQNANGFLKLLSEAKAQSEFHPTAVEAILKVASSTKMLKSDCSNKDHSCCQCLGSPSFNWNVLHTLLLGSMTTRGTKNRSHLLPVLSTDVLIDTILSSKSVHHYHYRSPRLVTQAESISYLIAQTRFECARQANGVEGMRQEWKTLMHQQQQRNDDTPLDTSPHLVRPLVALIRSLLISHGTAAPRMRVIERLFDILRTDGDDGFPSNSASSIVSTTELSITILLALLKEVYPTITQLADPHSVHSMTQPSSNVNLPTDFVSRLVSTDLKPWDLLQAGIQATILFFVLTEDLRKGLSPLPAPLLTELRHSLQSSREMTSEATVVMIETAVLSEFIETALAIQQWLHQKIPYRHFLCQTLSNELQLIKPDTLSKLYSRLESAPPQLKLLLGDTLFNKVDFNQGTIQYIPSQDKKKRNKGPNQPPISIKNPQKQQQPRCTRQPKRTPLSLRRLSKEQQRRKYSATEHNRDESDLSGSLLDGSFLFKHLRSSQYVGLENPSERTNRFGSKEPMSKNRPKFRNVPGSSTQTAPQHTFRRKNQPIV